MLIKTSLIAVVFSAIMSVFITGSNAESQGIEPFLIPCPPEFGIRVLLDDNAKKITFAIDDEYQIINFDTTKILNASGTTGSIEVTVDNNSIKIGRERLNTRRAIIQPQTHQFFRINDDLAYRGNLEIIINADNKTMMVINNVQLEIYLAGVIAAEMPSYWEIETLKAQAIAARTYCLYMKSKFGKNRRWDVRTTQANQVYKGVRVETMRTTEAVRRTAGVVLCCEQELGCEEFPSYYSSACGGHTENSENVFGDSFPPLRGVDCPYCRKSARPTLFNWPQAVFDQNTVTKNILDKYPALIELGQIVKIEPSKESNYDNNFRRVVSVKLTGSTGKTAILRAEDLRLSIDPSGMKIQSTCCTIVSLPDEGKFIFIAGKGFGHGVGLCQYGSREMARQGKTAEQILIYYYPNSRLKSLY
jgi:stage II sporulation protein D